MTYEEVMDNLKELGTEQTKRTLLRHGAHEPLFGVRIGDMKKLVKHVKKDRGLAVALYDSGNYDAMYLAGLSIDPKSMTADELRHWADRATWHGPAEYTVAGVAAESMHTLELAKEWIASEEEMKAICGWSTYANYVSITPDEQLDIEEIRGLLHVVRDTIHQERNWVRYTMNGFVIAAGSYVRELQQEALDVARAIGKVHVDVGQTACKVPLAEEYIHKVESAGKLGVKRKSCIC